MSLNKVSDRVLQAVYTRLADVNTGFNIGIVKHAPAYQIPPFIKLDFSNTSNNFRFAHCDPDQLEQTAVFQYPMALLYIQESVQTGTQKFNQFSGRIRCILSIFLSWKEMRGLQNFEKYCCCVEDVVIDVINREANQNWGSPLVYNGDIHCRRGPLKFAAENWRQEIGFSMLFEVHQ